MRKKKLSHAEISLRISNLVNEMSGLNNNHELYFFLHENFDDNIDKKILKLKQEFESFYKMFDNFKKARKIAEHRKQNTPFDIEDMLFDNNVYYTKKKIASLLDCSERIINQWLKTGLLPFERDIINKNKVLIKKDDLKNFILDNPVKSNILALTRLRIKFKIPSYYSKVREFQTVDDYYQFKENNPFINLDHRSSKYIHNKFFENLLLILLKMIYKKQYRKIVELSI